jgi:hypothetical protein
MDQTCSIAATVKMYFLGPKAFYSEVCARPNDRIYWFATEQDKTIKKHDEKINVDRSFNHCSGIRSGNAFSEKEKADQDQ